MGLTQLADWWEGRRKVILQRLYGGMEDRKDKQWIRIICSKRESCARKLSN